MIQAPQFVDMSQFQPPPDQINWPAYKTWAEQWDKKSRVALRSGYGYGYRDQHFDAYRAGALAVGIDMILYYHYSYPSLNSAIAEANSQHGVVGSVRPQDLLILDFEENVNAATSEWALTWLQTQEANYGKLPGIYASSAYIAQRLQDPRLKKYPLWLANWRYTPDERPPVPAPWGSYQFVQFTDKATNIPGVPGTVDCNIFLGVELPIEEEPMPKIDLTNGTVASHFSGGPNVWKCTNNGFFVGYAILDFYQKFGADALCGLTFLGLPQSNETPVQGHAGVVYQRFERGVVIYDPQHVIDNPPGSGDVYCMHITSGLGRDPQIADLQKQITALQAEVTTLQTQLAGDTLAQDLAALQSKVAQAVKDLS